MVHVAKTQDSADAKLRPQEGKELARATEKFTIDWQLGPVGCLLHRVQEQSCLW